MGEQYVAKYDVQGPMCYQKRCVCPPMFEPIPVVPSMPGFKALLPPKCDKRELQAMIVATPGDSAYRGTMMTMFCCINVDPRRFIPENGVYFVQNGTRKREPTSTPYDGFSTDIDTLFNVPTCWSLTINNVQMSDSGSYMCLVQPLNPRFKTLNATMEFAVKTPRMIQNVTITSNVTSAEVMWDAQEGPSLKIDLELFRRLDRKTRVWRKMNAKSPVLIENLDPATPYTLFITVVDGQTEPFRLTEQFQTDEGEPDPPVLEDIRVINADNGMGQMCEIEWRPPKRSRGHITRYYVQVSGKIRYVSPDSRTLMSDDIPQGSDLCSNFDGNPLNSIDPQSFHNFYACKYGPLKPNRNYSAVIWAENKAGNSKQVTFHQQCITDFAEPDEIAPPEPLLRTNTSSFGLIFTEEPEETNGPIACYYLAIVPLPENASIESLPSPELIVMDTYDKALQQNLNPSAAETGRYFAYIAESYMQYPKSTIIGNGDTSGGVEPCNVLYLTRYKPMDSALRSELKYTGFLIARVDRDQSLQASNDDHRLFNRLRSGRSVHYAASSEAHQHRRSTTARRQLTSLDPAYGFSNYFKPVVLQNGDGGRSALDVVLIFFFLILFVFLASTAVLYFLHKKGVIKHLCPMKKNHTLMRHAFHPIPVEELPSEYIIRHRDSDFLFTAEFDALPRGKNLDHTTSERKENARKNRYNDIKSCEATRVKLKKIPGDESSDYINANTIKGYQGRKVFIATQGPLENTVGDFWRMVWEQGARIVIMVANLRERGREQCTKYWPDEDDDPLIIRDLEVRPTESTYFADYTVREFELSCSTATPSSPSSPNGNGITRPISSSRHSVRSKSPAEVVVEQNGLLPRSDSMTSSRVSRAEESDYANVPNVLFRPNSKGSSRQLLVETNPREKRKVVQYHFTSWNDYKAPECTIGILRLLVKLRKLDAYNNHPVIIHCSAGVGRTGTLIAIDYAIDACADEGKADIFGCVAAMRQQRNLMVQSLEQYVFIYKALAEYHLFGDTDVSADDFRAHYQRLKQPASTRERHTSLTNVANGRSNSIAATTVRALLSGGKDDDPPAPASNGNSVGALLNSKLSQIKSRMPSVTGSNSTLNTARITLLEAEFNKLSIALEKPRPCDWARKDENASKNRFAEAVPFNANRVVLSPVIGYDNTYINASLIKGYFYPYILSQDPLNHETAFDFWRMIHDQNTYTLVMLSSEQDFESSEKYWPESETAPLQLGKNKELTVTLKSVAMSGTYAQRRLHYRFKNDTEGGREVVQFVYRHWQSGAPVPTTPHSLLDLIGRVLERQSMVPDAGPIILHCRDGSAENGLFCCVSLLLERLKAEHMVDVFRTVMSLQLQRPLLFNKVEQYAFCHECVIEYLNSCN
ncbi:CLR-1 protein [Aphelenchoides avenae]|nr:CLR-1 protein [Aphelenchus avenae]